MPKSHRELHVWQKSMALARNVYALTSRLPHHEQFGLSSQMRRAAVSVPSNIAEGQQRGHIKEYQQFPRVAYGSAAELETQLMIARDVYEDISCSDELEHVVEIQKMLHVLIQKLQPRT